MTLFMDADYKFNLESIGTVWISELGYSYSRLKILHIGQTKVQCEINYAYCNVTGLRTEWITKEYLLKEYKLLTFTPMIGTFA